MQWHHGGLTRRHSGPQGQVKPHTIIDDPADWTSSSLKGKEDEFTYVITEDDKREILQVFTATCLLNLFTPE